jgi:hypothetical protein
MQTTSLQQLRDDTAAVIAATENGEVLVVDGGKVVAVVSEPKPAADFAAYWEQRERQHQSVVSAPEWNSTDAVSEDRNRA